MKHIFVWLSLMLASPLFASALPPEVEKFYFMPENELHKEDRVSELSQIDEPTFNAVIEELAQWYKPIVAAHGAKLQAFGNWKSSTVNAYAVQNGDSWQIHFFGGLARRKEITRDGFQLVGCHEIGHHLAGFPFVEEGMWAANEGQSDYFVSLTCARELWKVQADKNKAAAKIIEKFPKKLCDDSWKKQDDKYLCYRILLAAKSVSDLLSAGTARFETPSKVIIHDTMNTHPPGQCRLDTYVAGSACKAKWDSKVIPQDEDQSKAYTCSEGKGARPKCWFRPA